MSMTGDLIQTQDALQPLFDAAQEEGIDTATREERELALHNGILAHLKQVDGVVRWFHYGTAQIELLKAEKAAVQAAIDLWEKKQRTVRQIIAAHLEATGQKKLQGASRSITFRKGATTVEILNDIAIPAAYKTQVVTYKVDKKAIKEALENFEDVPGAALVEGPPTVVVK